MSSRSILWTGVGAIALGLATLHTADAAVISNVSNRALSATPVTISLNGGAATLAFTAVAQTGNGPGAAVATTGTGQVTTIFGQVTDFAIGSTIDGTGLYTFASYATPSPIQFSAADDFIGFSYTQSDGTHYGYAEVAGASLVGYGYETAPNTTILTGATGGGGGVTSTPEPASFALLLGGLAAVTVGRRRKV